MLGATKVFSSGSQLQNNLSQFQNVNYWLTASPNAYQFQTAGSALQIQSNDAMVKGIKRSSSKSRRTRPCSNACNRRHRAPTAEDQLSILLQAGLYLTATRGYAAPEALICYERAESLCVSLSRPHLLFSALMGRWRYSLQTAKLTATMQIADHFYSLAQEQNDSALIL